MDIHAILYIYICITGSNTCILRIVAVHFMHASCGDGGTILLIYLTRIHYFTYTINSKSRYYFFLCQANGSLDVSHISF